MSQDTPRKSASLLATARAVLWALLGVRKHSGYQDDMRRLHPLKVMLVAVVALVLLVAGLILLAKLASG